MLTIVAIVWKKKVRKFLCRCDCGNLKLLSPSKFGVTKCCGCKSWLKRKENINFKGYEDISGYKWYSYKHGAKLRKLPFTITIQYAWRLYLKQNRKCALTGREIKFGLSRKPSSASLDRINNNKGYTPRNVWWVHKDVNKVKMNLTTKQFINLCTEVYKNANRK